jgi:hypothetical protein
MSDEFLGYLAGSWSLTGTTGSAELRQRVNARWVVQNRFLQVHFLAEVLASQGRPRYEAVYMLGYDDESQEYVLHLFDTFGASYARTLGIGVRRGDSVEFIFQYPKGQFSNTFSWDREKGTWKMLLRQRGDGGDWESFATKTLVRR